MDDIVVQKVTALVTRAREGDADSARAELVALWGTLIGDPEPVRRCVLAHYLADLYPDPAESLIWNVRALDAADATTVERTVLPDIAVAGFGPSLHLNLADDLRRLGSFEAARRHLLAARAADHTLADDDYGRTIRVILDEVEHMVDRCDTAVRPSAPATR